MRGQYPLLFGGVPSVCNDLKTKTASIFGSRLFIGAGRGNRTPTLLLARDFESRASTSSAIPAMGRRNYP
jgi:hypothetical protein